MELAWPWICILSILTHIEAKGTGALPIEKARVFVHVAKLKQLGFFKLCLDLHLYL